MHFVTWLTVSESKRLLAKGLAATQTVRAALDTGIVVIAPGTTDAYVAEEILGEALDKRSYVTGKTLPHGYDGPGCRKELPDLVLVNGSRSSLSMEEAVAELGPEDVFIKGGNALNYDLDQVGVLIGHPTGGTLGQALGTIMAKRVHLIHPVGLEKSVPGDLREAAALLKERDGKGPALWVSPGVCFTEIEALAVLAEVTAVPVGAGGIGGAEGALWLAVCGGKQELARAEEVLAGVRGEPEFLSD